MMMAAVWSMTSDYCVRGLPAVSIRPTIRLRSKPGHCRHTSWSAVYRQISWSIEMSRAEGAIWLS